MILNDSNNGVFTLSVMGFLIYSKQNIMVWMYFHPRARK